MEIYNEMVGDLLAPPGSARSHPVQIHGGTGGGGEVVLAPLREEVVTSLKGVKEVLRRGEGNRRTACTDWNERSSRSHSVFRMVIESRERGGDEDGDSDHPHQDGGRHTPALGGRQTPGGRAQTPGPGPRLQAKGGRSVRTSVLVRVLFLKTSIYTDPDEGCRVLLTLLGRKRLRRTRSGRERESISIPGGRVFIFYYYYLDL